MARKTKIPKLGSDDKPDKRNNISSSAPPEEEEYKSRSRPTSERTSVEARTKRQPQGRQAKKAIAYP